MNITDKRAEIAAALTGVDGVKGYARRGDVSTPREGDAWVMYRGSQRAEGWALTRTYAVVIVLPSTESTADAWIETREDDLFDALEPLIFIESFQPAVVPLVGNSEALALMITGRSE